jgi:hypothetical protein
MGHLEFNPAQVDKPRSSFITLPGEVNLAP